MRITRKIDYWKKGVGVAFDVGTTTVVGASVDLSSGDILGTVSLPNPQARWGRDVLSRINAVLKDPPLLSELSASVRSACMEIIDELGAKNITEITIAGNPVMEHIFLNVSPEPLSRVPYKPAFTEAKKMPAIDAGLKVDKNTMLYAFPLIGGFVGGDAVAVVLSTDMHKKDETTLAIDIGTNSEIMLSAGGVIYATSAAAGPAFEGGEIKYGMTAGKGAIQAVSIEKENIRLDVIGSSVPKGICGSGVLDCVRALLEAGILDKSGRIKNKAEISNNLSNRIKEEDGGNSFILFRGPSGEVAITQNDIRALQSAKSAIKAGISMLLKKAKIEPSQVDKVYIAGAFGSNIKKEGLLAAGILEEAWMNKVYPVGDAALEGAIMGLSDDIKMEAEALAKGVKFVSLSGSAHFEKEFIRNMNF